MRFFGRKPFLSQKVIEWVKKCTFVIFYMNWNLNFFSKNAPLDVFYAGNSPKVSIFDAKWTILVKKLCTMMCIFDISLFQMYTPQFSSMFLIKVLFEGIKVHWFQPFTRSSFNFWFAPEHFCSQRFWKSIWRLSNLPL